MHAPEWCDVMHVIWERRKIYLAMLGGMVLKGGRQKFKTKLGTQTYDDNSQLGR